MHPNVHCSTVYSSQDLGAAQMSTGMGMDTEDVVHMHDGMLLSHVCNEILLSKIMPLAVTWMDLEFLILSEIRKRKGKICNIAYTCNLKEENK